MIDNFDDFCLCMYYLVDNMWKQIAPLFKRPGPEPRTCSDSELLTLALVGECRGWDQETDMLSHWAEHRDLFPSLPSQSRFNRRRRNLCEAVNLIRQRVVQEFDLAHERYTIIDSLPVPVVEFHHAPRANDDWKIHEASFAKVSAKQQTIYGYKLHLLITLEGIIVDALLAPDANREVRHPGRGDAALDDPPRGVQPLVPALDERCHCRVSRGGRSPKVRTPWVPPKTSPDLWRHRSE